MAEKGSITSPRLQQLQDELEAGKKDALGSFWKEIKAQGTPLVEEIEGDDRHRLVAFLWQASGDLLSVSLVSLMTNPSQYYMMLIPDTDIWYLSLKLPSDLRATYQFFPEERSASAQRSDDTVWDPYLPDPLNPNIFAFYTEDEDPTGVKFARSVLELPDASSQPWTASQKGIAKGKVHLHTMESKILGNERRVWVYSPAKYTAELGRPLSLMILFDGWAYANLMPTFTILDNLIADQLIPPTVVVMLDSLDTETRLKELVFHPPFNQFLVSELLPWIYMQYAVTTAPAKTVIGGSSAGGLAAAYAALEHPQTFGNVLSQSGAFSLSPSWETDFSWIARQYALREKESLRFHLDVGKLEENSYRELRGRPSALEGNRHMRDALMEKGYLVHYVEFSGGHDYVSWQGTLGEGIKALLE